MMQSALADWLWYWVAIVGGLCLGFTFGVWLA
jgi:hypothetical protein